MKVNINHGNLELTEAIKSYASSKLEIISKYVKDKEDSLLRIDFAKVSLHHKHGDFYEVKAHLKDADRNIHVEAVSEDVYKSIDEVKDKMVNEIATGGDKKRSLFKKMARRFKDLIRRG